MAIKVNNVTVIDDSRNLTNLGSVSLNNTTGSSQQVFVSTGSSTAYVSGAVLYQNINAGYVGIQSYSSPGTFTVGTNCPSSIKYILIAGCGGGGNGGNGAPGLPNNPSIVIRVGSGGGGGSSSPLFYIIREVSNGEVFSITVGGAGGNSTVSTPGPTTIATFLGGNPGTNGSTTPAPTSAGTSGGVLQNTLPFSQSDIFGVNGNGGGAGTAGGSRSTSPDTETGIGGDGGAGGGSNYNYFKKNDIRLGSPGSAGLGGIPPGIPGLGSRSTEAGGNSTGFGGGGGGGGGGGTGPGATTVSIGQPGGTGSPGTVIFVW